MEHPKALPYLRVIAASAAFVAITWGLIITVIASAIVWDMLTPAPQADAIRLQHVDQHISEHEQFARMIELLEALNEPSVPPITSER